MASWLVHLRIADELADEFNVNLTEFVIGNLAPDSGEILNDGSYQPPAKVTHWKTSTSNRFIQPDDFYKEYLSSCKNSDKSFYLGYFSHLITDYYWHKRLLELCDNYCWDRHDSKYRHMIYSLNYNVDMLYLRQHPEMRALNVLMRTNEFENTYLDYFGKDAIINKDSPLYMNFEMNSNGAFLASVRTDRNNKTHIHELTTLPEVKAVKHDDFWIVETFFSFEQINALFGKCDFKKGDVIYGNFYKCGDKTQFPHFGMWSPINMPSPDFHQPKFFGELIIS